MKILDEILERYREYRIHHWDLPKFILLSEVERDRLVSELNFYSLLSLNKVADMQIIPAELTINLEKGK